MLLFRWRQRRELSFPGANLFTLGSALVAICVAPRALGPTVDILAMLALFPLIILAGSGTRPAAQPVADRLGDLSYPLYIIHWPVLIAVDRAGGSGSIGFAGACLTAIILAELAFHLFDLPVRTWLTARLRERERRARSPIPRADA